MLEENVATFVQQSLENAAIDGRKSKFIHDPLWGTIKVTAAECQLLDTPLLQRLKLIHQTGFVFQTYPSARHTRFDHTLGVMHLAGRIAEALQKRYPDMVDDTSVQSVRFAALLHDAGHSAFSHTSEEVFALCEDMDDFQRRNVQFANSGAGEILSYLIVTSAPFRAFFKGLKERLQSEVLVDVDDFAPLITGKPRDRAKHFEAEIISGPFDADKLDYFPRDGRSAGLQLALDFERLLHCMEIVHVDDAKGEKTLSLVVNRGGFNPIQQLLFARATLTATVYHHQKVRACDSMVKSCFARFQDKGIPFNKSPANPTGLSLTSAAHFLHITDSDFFAEAYQHERSSALHKVIADVFNRRLFKRILTISYRTVSDPDGGRGKRYRRFLDLREDPEELRAICIAICKEVGDAQLSPYDVWLDLPSTPTFDKAGRARIRLGGEGATEGLVKLSEFIPVDQWVETYNQWYSQSYLFGPPDKALRTRIAIAGLCEFKERFGLELADEAIADDVRDAVVKQMALPARRAEEP